MELLHHPHSIRFTSEEWMLLEQAAGLFGIEPAVFVRRIALKKLTELGPEIEKRKNRPKDQELF